MNAAIAAQRLRNQRISAPRARGPVDVVGWLGAVQAQEYRFAKWALALRTSGARDAQIERAFDEGRILRTHLMRSTWHFVAPADIRWMLELTAPRVQRALRSFNRQLGLDTATLNRALDVLVRCLGKQSYRTRAELGDELARAGIQARGQRLAQIAMHAELLGVLCSGPRRGRQFTYALLAERAPSARRMPRDEALFELTRRYFTSQARPASATSCGGRGSAPTTPGVASRRTGRGRPHAGA